MWAAIVVLVILLSFVRIQIRREVTYVCPKCDQDADGRRCYTCRLEAAPDETPTVLPLWEFIRAEAADLYRRKIRRQKWDWHPF